MVRGLCGQRKGGCEWSFECFDQERGMCWLLSGSLLIDICSKKMLMVLGGRKQARHRV